MARLITLLYWFTESSKLMLPDSSKRMTSLAGSGFKREEDHLNIKIVAALFVVMPTYYIFVEMYDLKQISLRCTLQGCQHIKPTFKMSKFIKCGLKDQKSWLNWSFLVKYTRFQMFLNKFILLIKIWFKFD